MNSNSVLPEWMKEEEDYQPNKDRDGFVTKSIMKILGILKYAREEGSNGKKQTGAPFKILMTFYLILLTCLSKNMFFTYCMIAGVLLRCVTLPGKALARVVKTTLGVTLLSVLFLLPAVFLGSPHSMILVSSKVMVSVGLVGILTATTEWNQITEGLGFFKIPDLFILTLDLTLMYIVILGNLCVDLLQSVSLRSVGKNKNKSSAMSGVLGATYLKSQEMAEETYQSMVCRGFEGEYQKKRTFRFQKEDVFRILILVLATFLFLWLEFAL